MIVGDMLRFLPSQCFMPSSSVCRCWLVLRFSVPDLLIASWFTLIVPISINETVGIFQAVRRNCSVIGKVWRIISDYLLLCCYARERDCAEDRHH